MKSNFFAFYFMLCLVNTSVMAASVSYKAQVFECQVNLAKNGQVMATKKIEVCSSCSMGSTKLGTLLDEGTKGSEEKFLSIFESKRLDIYGSIDGLKNEAHIGLYRIHEKKSRASYSVEEEKEYLITPTRVESERSESIPFENYDLDISCKHLEKTVQL